MKGKQSRMTHGFALSNWLDGRGVFFGCCFNMEETGEENIVPFD